MKLSQEQACKILEIQGSFDLKELKIKYRLASSKYHPDRNPGGQEMMKMVNVAYDLLKKNPVYQSSGQSKSSGRNESWREHYSWREHDRPKSSSYTKPHWAQDSNGRYYWNDENKKEPEPKNCYKSILYTGNNEADIKTFLYVWESSLSINFKPLDFKMVDHIYPGSKRFIWGRIQFNLWPEDVVYITQDRMSWGIYGKGFIG
jgi:curved DNA-binding protein CbpA